MASPLTHAVVAVTMAAGFRIPVSPFRYWLLGIACAEMPDIDTLGYWLGVPYDASIGHRGLTHSIVFAVLLSWIAMRWAARWESISPGWLWCYLFLATLSHDVLDAMTNGGLGVAFFWPFDNARYFFPYHPIKVTPLEPSLVLGPAGLAVLISEAIWVWVPCAMFAGAWKLIESSRSSRAD